MHVSPHYCDVFGSNCGDSRDEQDDFKAILGSIAASLTVESGVSSRHNANSAPDERIVANWSSGRRFAAKPQVWSAFSALRKHGWLGSRAARTRLRARVEGWNTSRR